ncbi:MAG: response regulator, partial [Flavobacteriaceae bacterium]|nr:response regulator [Flavobacteriaceae bacterium]
MDKKYKLILVEDDNALGYLLSEYLGMKGFMVTWAKDASQAILKTKTNVFDLAILDVMLPDMDGFELSQKIKGINPELPFIFLTARSLKIDVLKGFSLGAVDYLKKPIDEEELVVR